MNIDILRSLRLDALEILKIGKPCTSEFYRGGIHGVMTEEEAFKKADVVINKWSNTQVIQAINEALKSY